MLDRYISEGLGLNEVRDYELAIEFFNKALEEESSNEAALFGKSVALHRMGNHLAAIDLLEQIQSAKIVSAEQQNLLKTEAMINHIREHQDSHYGKSIDRAFEIFAESNIAGIQQEAGILEFIHGSYTKKMQALLEEDGVHYDRLTIDVNGKEYIYYFNIERFFGMI